MSESFQSSDLPPVSKPPQTTTTTTTNFLISPPGATVSNSSTGGDQISTTTASPLLNPPHHAAFKVSPATSVSDTESVPSDLALELTDSASIQSAPIPTEIRRLGTIDIDPPYSYHPRSLYRSRSEASLHESSSVRSFASSHGKRKSILDEATIQPIEPLVHQTNNVVISPTDDDPSPQDLPLISISEPSWATSRTQAVFKWEDCHPRRHRRSIFHLRDAYERMELPDPVPKKIKVRKDKKDKTRNLQRLNTILQKKRFSGRSTSALFHTLRIAIHDERSDLALAALEHLTANTLKRKRIAEANYMFLLAMTKRMEGVAVKLFERGVPADVNSPILYNKTKKGGKPRLVYPSYFLLAVSFNLRVLTHAMIKKADTNQTWYGMSPLLVASSLAGVGDAALVALLLQHDADPNLSIPLELFHCHRRVRTSHQPTKVCSPPNTPAIPALLPKNSRKQLKHVASDYDAPDGHSLSTPGSNSPRRTGSPSGPSPKISVTRHVCERNHNPGRKGLPKMPSMSWGIPKATQDDMPRFREWRKGRNVFPLDCAASVQNLDIVTMLSERMSVQAISKNSLGFLVQGNLEISLELLRAGLSIHQTDWSGSNVLHLAAADGRTSMCALGIIGALDVNSPRSTDQCTALHIAVCRRNRDIVRLLLKSNADATLRNSTGLTAFELGSQSGIPTAELDSYFDTSSIPSETETLLRGVEKAAVAAIRQPKLAGDSRGNRIRHGSSPTVPLPLSSAVSKNPQMTSAPNLSFKSRVKRRSTFDLFTSLHHRLRSNSNIKPNKGKATSSTGLFPVNLALEPRPLSSSAESLQGSRTYGSIESGKSSNGQLSAHSYGESLSELPKEELPPGKGDKEEKRPKSKMTRMLSTSTKDPSSRTSRLKAIRF